MQPLQNRLMLMSRLHPLSVSQEVELPTEFTCPFHYTPHPLCVQASKELMCYLSDCLHWKEELDAGKMFGVLVVRDEYGKIGFLAAFSGLLDGKNNIPYFVPPVFDLLEEDGFFKKGEQIISDINLTISMLETSSEYKNAISEFNEANIQRDNDIKLAKIELETAKTLRDEERKNNPSVERIEEMLKESQFQKAELKRLRKKWDDSIIILKDKVCEFENEIEKLKNARKQRSLLLQLELFSHFNMLNAKGETKNLLELFKSTSQHIPPSGAGECAAPKLLQYAYRKKMKPLAMAEFWWGASPKKEIRHHGFFYPACQSKCAPILSYMLQGLTVEANLLERDSTNIKLEIVYEDDWLVVVNKPEGLLSAPGKSSVTSVCSIIKDLYPDADGPLIVHRLDMSTSGLLLIAKNKSVHQNLQSQFKNHTIHKTYIAILAGIVKGNSGTISLPLGANYNDRPRQEVNHDSGKQAITHYRVIGYKNNETRIEFTPITGRTHQLRVHAAYHGGLNTPIKGDSLYGKKADRLYLHASSIEFIHPISGKIIRVEKNPDF